MHVLGQPGDSTIGALTYRGKRALDVALAIVVAVLTIPVLLACAAVSLVAFRAWPFFTQQREGLNGHPFKMVKIRSLSTKVPRDLDRNQLDSYPTSRWGDFLRRTHLDELPQIWQVITGTMSMVGPRPMIVSICDQMDDEFRSLRCQVRPGVTGLWQISEDGARLVIDAMHHDSRYLMWSSLRVDLRILWETVWQVAGGRRLDEADIRHRFASVIEDHPAGESGD